VHELTIRSFSPPACIAHPGARLLHDYWAAFDSPSELSFVCYAPYNIGDNNIVQRSTYVSNRYSFTYSCGAATIIRIPFFARSICILDMDTCIRKVRIFPPKQTKSDYTPPPFYIHPS